MPRDRDRGYARIAERNRLALGEDQITGRRRRTVGVSGSRRFLDKVPVRRHRADSRTVTVLKVRSPAIVIPVPVAKQHVLHIRRVQAEFDQSRYENRLDSVRVTGVDENDPLGGRDRMDDRLRVARSVEVVEQLYRLELRSSSAVASGVTGYTKEFERRGTVRSRKRPRILDMR